MTIVLIPRYAFEVPVEGRNISPDAFADKPLEAVRELEAWEGNRRRGLGDLFLVEEAEGRHSIAIHGDVSKVKRIGRRMTGGSIAIHGDVGPYVGEAMKGGSIVVYGNAGPWAGTRMKGGSIVVYGNADGQVGSAYRGSTRGMKGGTIVIHGDAGNEVGLFMRGGNIRVKGNAGLFPGMHMRGGNIIVEGNCEGRAGAGMVKGRIVICGRIPSILPSFHIGGRPGSVKVAGERIPGPFYVFDGDAAEGGRGRVYVSVHRNAHLKPYERFL